MHEFLLLRFSRHDFVSRIKIDGKIYILFIAVRLDSKIRCALQSEKQKRMAKFELNDKAYQNG